MTTMTTMTTMIIRTDLQAQTEAVASILERNRRAIPDFRLEQLEAAHRTLNRLNVLRHKICTETDHAELIEEFSQEFMALLELSDSKSS